MDLDKYKYFNLQISNSAVEIQINRPEKRMHSTQRWFVNSVIFGKSLKAIRI